MKQTSEIEPKRTATYEIDHLMKEAIALVDLAFLLIDKKLRNDTYEKNSKNERKDFGTPLG